jgi:hypothetical protein
MSGSRGPLCRIQAFWGTRAKCLTRLRLEVEDDRSARAPAQQVCAAARSFVSPCVLLGYDARFGT